MGGQATEIANSHKLPNLFQPVSTRALPSVVVGCGVERNMDMDMDMSMDMGTKECLL